jgi:hypothetical protein
MIIIAHRGNTDGPNPKRENEPFYIDLAIDKGFVAEIDVWYIENTLYLGHDKPEHVVEPYWITERREKLIIHQKNIECCLCPALIATNRFTHNIDDYAMTSFNVGWTTKKELVNENTIWVINERKEELDNIQLLGICTDYANYYHTL